MSVSVCLTALVRVVVFAGFWFAATGSNAWAQAAGDVVLYTAEARSAVVVGGWSKAADATAAAGAYLVDADAGVPALAAAASPASYFELRFWAKQNTPYRVWMRGRAEGNSFENDTAWFQFSSSVDSSGAPVYRIGTTDAMKMLLQEYQGAPISGWGWHDNGWGDDVRGVQIYFSDTGYHTLRVQTREDGLQIDQIVLSPGAGVPGEIKNDTTILKRDVVVWAADLSASSIAGLWTRQPDTDAAGGYKVRHPNAGVAKIDPPLASPSNYFEHTIYVQAGVQYRVWMRGEADANHYENDSVSVQFTNSRNQAGVAAYLIGTADGLKLTLQEYTAAPISGWGWHDDGWGDNVRGETVSFATSGVQTIRVQTREDGLAIDQLVLSPLNYLTVEPGATTGDNKQIASSQQVARPDVAAVATPDSGGAPLVVNFTTSTTPAETLTYSWDFGDGSAASTSAAPVHTYASAGNYTARVTASNSGVPRDSAELLVVVTPGGGTSRQVTVVQWNIHKGREECPLAHSQCPSNLEELTDELARYGADVVSLNEVYYLHSSYQYGGSAENQPLRIEQMLEAKTGQCWIRHFTNVDGGGEVAGKLGNLLLWRSSTDGCGQAQDGFDHRPPYRHSLPSATDGNRSAGAVELEVVPGRWVPFFTTHLCAPLSTPGCATSERQTQINDLKSWASTIGQGVAAGDFNAQPPDSEIAGSSGMTATYFDLWAKGLAEGKASPANASQPTHHGGYRFDYAFLSKTAASVSLVSILTETRDSRWDHYAVVAKVQFD